MIIVYICFWVYVVSFAITSLTTIRTAYNKDYNGCGEFIVYSLIPFLNVATAIATGIAITIWSFNKLKKGRSK
jgi:hypothetical protein